MGTAHPHLERPQRVPTVCRRMIMASGMRPNSDLSSIERKRLNRVELRTFLALKQPNDRSDTFGLTTIVSTREFQTKL